MARAVRKDLTGLDLREESEVNRISEKIKRN